MQPYNEERQQLAICAISERDANSRLKRRRRGKLRHKTIRIAVGAMWVVPNATYIADMDSLFSKQMR